MSEGLRGMEVVSEEILRGKHDAGDKDDVDEDVGGIWRGEERDVKLSAQSF